MDVSSFALYLSLRLDAISEIFWLFSQIGIALGIVLFISLITTKIYAINDSKFIQEYNLFKKIAKWFYSILFVLIVGYMFIPTTNQVFITTLTPKVLKIADKFADGKIDIEQVKQTMSILLEKIKVVK